MNKTAVAQPAKITNSLLPVQGLLQRKCACGNHTPAGRQCAECAKKKTSMQRKLVIGASNDPLESRRSGNAFLLPDISFGDGAA